MNAGRGAPTAQLPLGFTLAPGTTLASYFAGPNALAVALLRDMAAAGGEQQLYLTGAPGLGKSHLLQAACRAAGERGDPVAYLPLGQAADLDPDAVDGLEALALVAVDDLDRVAGHERWEAALFRLVNAARASGTHLVLAARAAPGELGVALPDLASRLAWGPVVRLTPLDDDAKRDALVERARQLGLELPAATARYLVRHQRRDLAGLLARLDELDRASLAAGRRLTVPFVREVLSAARDSDPPE